MAWRLASALALFAAAAGAAGQEALVANPPLPTVALTLVARGRPHHYTVEVARTGVEQARGLMLRKTMAHTHGMLFPMVPPRLAAFWMEGTILPLDIVFVAPDHRVGRIAANAVPFDRTEIASGGPVEAVLELRAGEASRIGLRPGDSVRYALDDTAQPR